MKFYFVEFAKKNPKGGSVYYRDYNNRDAFVRRLDQYRAYARDFCYIEIPASCYKKMYKIFSTSDYILPWPKNIPLPNQHNK
jgi:hypothetical protein